MLYLLLLLLLLVVLMPPEAAVVSLVDWEQVYCWKSAQGHITTRKQLAEGSGYVADFHHSHDVLLTLCSLRSS